MPVTLEMLEKRAALARTGGPGSVRRTVKAQHRGSSGEDKKVQGTLKKLGVTPLSEIDEATFFKADGSVMIFENPKVQASMQSQCFVVSGNYDTKSVQDYAASVLGAATA
jgi:nascent polypeptide-associated complex subunit beta